MLRRRQTVSPMSSNSRGVARSPAAVVRNPRAVVERVEPRTMFAVVAEVPSQSFTPGQPQLVFTDIATGNTNGASATVAQAVTLRNTGGAAVSISSALILDDPSVAGDHASQFEQVNWPGVPAMLAPGQTLTLNVSLRAATTGVKAAVLRLQTSDAATPTIEVALRGIGTGSESSGDVGGNKEPSLQRILNAFQIPVNVGDANGEATFDLPTPRPAGTVHEEIEMQRLVKAGGGPVVIQPLAEYAFNTKTGPIGHFGYYTPGTKDAKTELFAVAANEYASTSPTWGGAFDPGAAPFALYGDFNGGIFEINGLPRGVYSEDALNTWDANNKKKVRFFPLKNKDGGVVTDAFVFAFEEFNAGYDSNDVVGIIRNVRPAPGGPEVGTTNLDRGVPFPDRLVFNRISVQPPTTKDPITGETITLPNNAVHNKATVRLHNTGDQPLTITSVVLSDPGSYQVNTGGLDGSVIAPGGTRDIEVEFKATSGEFKNATLTINTNDADEPATVIQLAGHRQNRSENNEEPSLQEIIGILGYGTTITNPGEPLNVEGDSGKVRATGDEVLSPYWRRADAARAVEVIQLAAYHTHANEETIRWHFRGSNTQTALFTHTDVDSQSLLPRLKGSAQIAAGVFKPATQGSDTNPAFGFKIGGVQAGEWSDPTKNTQEEEGGGFGHRVRFWPAKDRSGQVIPDAYLLAMDYLGVNYDYNDNIYLIRNIRPADAAGPALQPPSNLTATPSVAGVFLNWNDNPGGVAGYNVYRGDSPDFVPAAGNKLNGSLLTTSQYSDAAAPTGTTVFYKVVAVNGSGVESAPSSVSAVRPAAEPIPATPTGLAVTPVSATALNVTWNPSAGAARYVLERRVSGEPSFAVVADNLTSTSFSDTGVVPSTTYEYRVSAGNGVGQVSPPSAVASGRTLGVSDPVPPSATVADVSVTEPASGEAAVTFTVTLSAASAVPVTVGFTTADGTATAGADYTATSGTLTFNPGETVKTVTVPLLADAQDEGAEAFFLNLTAGGAEVVIADSQALATIAANGTGQPVPLPIGGRQRAMVPGQDGKTARVTLKGPGTGEVVFRDGAIEITATGTTPASAITITGNPLIRSVTINGALRSFGGKAVDLAGDISVAGSPGKVTLRNATGSRITAGGGAPITLTLGNATDLVVVSAAPIKSLRAAQWVDTGGTVDSLTAPLLSSGTIKGDFSADLIVGQLQRFNVNGAITGSDVRSEGDVTSLRAGSLNASRIFAGVKATQTGLPDSMDDFANPAARIGNVSVRSKAATGFMETLIAAPNVGALSLGSVVTGSFNGPFGVTADNLGTLRATAGSKLALKGLSEPGDSVSDGDFFVRVL